MVQGSGGEYPVGAGSGLVDRLAFREAGGARAGPLNGCGRCTLRTAHLVNRHDNTLRNADAPLNAS
jgi:hypothetical protein